MSIVDCPVAENFSLIRGGPVYRLSMLIGQAETERPQEATAVHGIKDEDVRNCPSFKELALGIRSFLSNCDLAGYNLIRFDLPLLQTEFARSEVTFSLDGRRVIDACQIFRRKEPRDLVAALKFFCGAEHSGAHSALNDVLACWKVLQAKIEAYEDLPAEMQGLHDFCNARDSRFVDQARKFEWRHTQ